jgi:hypothetical protein
VSEQIVPIAEIQRRAAEAFAADLPSSACPYPAGSSAHDAWVRHYAALSNRTWLEAA